MKQFAFTFRHGAILAMLFGLLLTCPALLQAQAPVKLQKFQGVVDFSTTPPTLTIEGTASHLGRFICKGQVVFAPGETPDTMIGMGPVVFLSANGDRLVGNMTWTVSAAAADNSRTTSIHFRWSDFVTLSDGTMVANTGRFISSRPPGLVVVVDIPPPDPGAVLIWTIIKILIRR